MRLSKTISCFLIIVLVLLPCMYCLYFQVKHHVIRTEMREKLESEQLQTVIIPVKEFRWYEEDREIIVDGMMFDVKSIEQQEENYVITGLYDEQETALYIAMGRLQQSQGSGPDPELISVILSQTWISPANVVDIALPEFSESTVHIVYPDESLYHTTLSIHTPPPRG